MSCRFLELKDVTLRFKSVAALEGARLELDSGELVAVIGPNGSGKTSLLSVAAGLKKPDSGAVLLEGRPMDSFKPRDRACRIAFVGQTGHDEWPFTVGEYILQGRFPRIGWLGREQKRDYAIAQQVAEEVGIQALWERRLDELSGGEYRRISIARALAQEAKTVILDEPDAHLDVRHQIAILEILRARVDAGNAVLASLHDLNLAARYADRIVLLDSGSIVSCGPAAEALQGDLLERVFGTPFSVMPGFENKGLPYVMPTPRR